MTIDNEVRPITFKIFSELALNDYQAYLSLLGVQQISEAENNIFATLLKTPEVKPPVRQVIQPLQKNHVLQKTKNSLVPTHIVLAVEGRESIKYKIKAKLTIGKKKSCAAVIQKDNEVSGEHAEIRHERGISVLCDTRSTNGTFLNGVRIIKPEPLNEGDCITVGRTEIRIYFV